MALNLAVLSKNNAIEFWRDLNLAIRCIRHESVDSVGRIQSGCLFRNCQIAKSQIPSQIFWLYHMHNNIVHVCTVLEVHLHFRLCLHARNIHSSGVLLHTHTHTHTHPGLALLIALYFFSHVKQPVGFVLALFMAVLGLFLPITLHRIPHDAGWENPTMMGALVLGVAHTTLCYIIAIWPNILLNKKH